jgi:hypothetical protein
MKKSVIVGLLAAFAALVLAAAAWADPPAQVGRVSLIEGAVSFHPGSLDEWAPATLNYPLTEGDHLFTDSVGRAEVQLLTAVIRLDGGTEFSFLSLDDQTVQVRLTEGSLSVQVRGVDPDSTFEIDTPNAAVSLAEPGSYRIDVREGGETTVTARSGAAQVATGGDSFDVPAGQSSVISGTDSVAYYVTGAPRLDGWDSWCAAREARVERSRNNPYVSREMIGAEDLSEHGSWIVVSGYGTAWAPASVPAGWAPYRYGHWAWVAPWGWTWIDDMPWGFAPFHYGRWALAGGRWVWVPGAAVARPVYAPALVVFVGGEGWTPSAGAGIGWFPLGPREVYVPPYRVSPAYVQRINFGHVPTVTPQYVETYNPAHVVYVNRAVPQGVTYVPREVFVQSRPAGGAFMPVSVAEVTRAPVGMTATVVPQRESVIARPFAPRTPVPQPAPAVMDRRVYSRTTPPPPPVPFAESQPVLRENPGRPIDPETYARMRHNERVAPPPVTVVNPGRPVQPAPQGPQPAPRGPQPQVQPQPQPRGPQPQVQPQPQPRGPQPQVQPQPQPRGPQPQVQPQPQPRGPQPQVQPQPQPRGPQPQVQPQPQPRGPQPQVQPQPQPRGPQPQVRPQPQPQQPGQEPAMRPQPGPKPQVQPQPQPQQPGQEPAMRPQPGPKPQVQPQPQPEEQKPQLKPANQPQPGPAQPQPQGREKPKKKLPEDQQGQDEQ